MVSHFRWPSVENLNWNKDTSKCYGKDTSNPSLLTWFVDTSWDTIAICNATLWGVDEQGKKIVEIYADQPVSSNYPGS